MSDKVFHFEPTDSGITAIMHHDPLSMIGCGIILDHATRTVLLRNGDGSEALIPADLLPEALTTARGDLDALRVVKHLVELIRKHEAEQKDLRMHLEAERLARLCNRGGCDHYEPCCPRSGSGDDCPEVRCGEIKPEDWLEFLRKEEKADA